MHSHGEEEHISGLPWLDKPVILHSSRADQCKLTPEQCAYRGGHWRYWYEADHVYALNTIYFLSVTVGVFAILHFVSRYAPAGVRKSSIWRNGTAVGRFIAYRGFRVPILGYWSASLGVTLLILAGVVFFFAMTLGPRPYYWPNTETVSYGGSQPIATRTGWMAVALLPFVLALGAKANLISALTGVPHEKLQIFHHWTSYAMFVLALIHTFPFIVKSISQGRMMSQWRTSVFYWTGVAALIPQAYLTFMSLPTIRNRYYEFFKSTHFIVALLFLLFLFFHCDFRLSSWDYFIAGGSLYLLCLFTALIRTHLINGRHAATLDFLPCGLLRIKIPTIMTWHPGQHIFIRFSSYRLGLHTLTSHPFTICSTSHDPAETGKASEMVFYVKPKRGITGRLAKLSTKSPGVSHAVLLEGPYGGVDSGVFARFESILIVSAGSGGGFSLPMFEETLRLYKNEPNHEIKVVFATPSQSMAAWYHGEVEALMTSYGASSNNISVSIYRTSNPNQDTNSGNTHPVSSEYKAAENETVEPVSSEESTNAIKNGSIDTFQHGRPSLPQIIATTAGSGKRTAIFACGPASMLYDVRNAAASEQEKILRGGSTGEVYLHSETFSW